MVRIHRGSSQPPPSLRKTSAVLQPISPRLENIPPPIYALPSTLDIRVSSRKRRREEENKDASVVGSRKRAKSLAANGGWKSTPRAVKSPKSPRRLGSPSIRTAAGYLETVYGYGSQGTDYECGSDTDPSSEEEEEEDKRSAVTVSDDSSSAEADDLRVHSEDTTVTPPFFASDSDSEGYDADEETEGTEFEAEDDEYQRVNMWSKPGPSPLRQVSSPDRPGRLSLHRDYKTSKSRRFDIIPIVRNSSRTDRSDGRKELLRRRYLEARASIMMSKKALGKRRAGPQDDISDNPAEAEQPTMGRGTPAGARFAPWTPLAIPPSPYKYHICHEMVPFREFSRCLFHGEDACATLLRDPREAEDVHDQGYVRHTMRVGRTDRQVEFRTNKAAMRHLRAHARELESVPVQLYKRTTGEVLEEAKRIREQARSPSPELQKYHSQGDDSEGKGVLRFGEESVEDLGAWVPSSFIEEDARARELLVGPNGASSVAGPSGCSSWAGSRGSLASPPESQSERDEERGMSQHEEEVDDLGPWLLWTGEGVAEPWSPTLQESQSDGDEEADKDQSVLEYDEAGVGGLDAWPPYGTVIGQPPPAARWSAPSPESPSESDDEENMTQSEDDYDMEEVL